MALGARLGSHVTGCSYALSPDVPDFPWVRDNIVGSYYKTAVEQATAAVEQFKDDAQKCEIPTSTEIMRTNLTRSLTAFGEEARLHDVTIVTQSQRGIDHAGDLFAEAALFYSGRPLILVPRDHSIGFSADRVLIAWDGSQHAARAVAQAAPILHLAKKLKSSWSDRKKRCSIPALPRS